MQSIFPKNTKFRGEQEKTLPMRSSSANSADSTIYQYPTIGNRNDYVQLNPYTYLLYIYLFCLTTRSFAILFLNYDNEKQPTLKSKIERSSTE